mmetsp:Transcript_10337/g.24893  ORF Transcript_10337/g.24893 Transcript_10337/m.24893 type:complete len:665 (+) Transcript_10337:118-2112(+)
MGNESSLPIDASSSSWACRCSQKEHRSRSHSGVEGSIEDVDMDDQANINLADPSRFAKYEPAPTPLQVVKVTMEPVLPDGMEKFPTRPFDSSPSPRSARTKHSSWAKSTMRLSVGSNFTASSASDHSGSVRHLNSMDTPGHAKPVLQFAPELAVCSTDTDVGNSRTIERPNKQKAGHDSHDGTENSPVCVHRKASRHAHHCVRLTETMGVVPSSALGVVINNMGKVDDFYKLDSKPLGEGSFGAVYYATLKVTKASRAVKKIAKARMREKLVTLKTEVQLLKLVDHPHVVMLHEIFEDDQDVHLVMSLCRGGHLQAYVMRYGRLKEQPAVAAMRQLFRAVAYLHRNSICHRDLKSENLMLLHDEPFTGSSRNTLKVTDFGLACFFQPGVPMISTAGTPSHMAPEVYAKKYNQACDLWSCGVIMFFVVTRLMPFDANEKGTKRFKYNMNVHPWDLIHQDCINLVHGLLDKSVHKRTTALAALQSPWILNNTQRVENVTIEPDILERLKKFRNYNRFKRACFSVAASFLKESETAASNVLFQFLDTAGNGHISLEDMSKLVGPEVANEIFGRDEGQETPKPFSYTEFLAATFDRKQSLTKAVCKTAFAAFDRNGDGSISMAELTSGRLLGQLSMVELNRTLKELDKNGDQVIDFQEFLSVIKDDGS